jgi:hypothetical protein
MDAGSYVDLKTTTCGIRSTHGWIYLELPRRNSPERNGITSTTISFVLVDGLSMWITQMGGPIWFSPRTPGSFAERMSFSQSSVIQSEQVRRLFSGNGSRPTVFPYMGLPVGPLKERGTLSLLARSSFVDTDSVQTELLTKR